MYKILLLLLFSTSLFAEKFKLNTGEEFTGKVIERGESFTVVQFEGKQFRIPNETISKIESDDFIKQSVYKKSGVVLRGYPARETGDSIVIETSEGFQEIKKDDISRIEKEEAPPPERFLYKPVS